MEKKDTSGKALVNFWTWASQKGEMNPHTAGSYKKACSQILQIEDKWETLDISTIDIESFCKRFQNKRSQDFKINSLSLYLNTFRKGVSSFLEYVADPSSWKFQVNGPKIRKERKSFEGEAKKIPSDNSQQPSSIIPIDPPAFIEYPFPLREGRLAYIKLPIDLKTAEVKRLTAHLYTLAIDAEV